MNKNEDAIIRVKFLTLDQGGRRTNLSSTSVDFYACPMFIDNEAFDCRIFLGGKNIILGEEYDLPVKFLSRDIVSTKLFPGRKIKLWEGKIVAEGEVIKTNLK